MVIIAATGHRPNKLDNDYQMTGKLVTKIKADLQAVIDREKPDVMITGMALGIDTIWALLAIENGIPLVAAIPCKNHCGKWPKKSQDLYKWIITQPNVKVHLVTKTFYTDRCMQTRNEWMVDKSTKVVAVWDGTPGGTGNCVRYAVSVDREIIPLDLNQIKESLK